MKSERPWLVIARTKHLDHFGAHQESRGVFAVEIRIAFAHDDRSLRFE